MPKESQASYVVYKDIFSSIKIIEVTECLKILHHSKLLTKENFNAIKEHKNPSVVAHALSVLNEAKFLTQEHFNAIKEHKNPYHLAVALSALNEAKLLTEEHFNAIKEHEYPYGLAKALSALNKAKLLTEEHFNAIKEHENFYRLSRALSVLKEAELLTSENFERLIQPENNILLTLIRIGRVTRNIIWNCMPPHLLTQPVFEELIRRASLENPAAEIQQYINLLLGNNDAGINNNQSTHTASIHDSVSTSATKLWSRYRAELLENDKVEKIITTIKKDIANLSDTLRGKAIKNCIERITQDDYIFTDSKSKVTLKQLLALSYLAINDDKARSGSLEDAKKQFITGLYEIQRGYNLSAGGVDDKQKDRPICTAGTFNKLMEKLSGIHPDVELLFITKGTATQKFPIIVCEEAKNYLEKLSKPETKEGLYSFIKLLKQLLKGDDIDIIWNKTKPKVADRLFDEFKSVFNNSREDADFLGLVDAGQYTQIKNVGDYQQQIKSSEGYRRDCSQIILQNHKFFSLEKRDYLSDHRHDNVESQRMILQ